LPPAGELQGSRGLSHPSLYSLSLAPYPLPPTPYCLHTASYPYFLAHREHIL
jgi:hypothetical protein